MDEVLAGAAPDEALRVIVRLRAADGVLPKPMINRGFSEDRISRRRRLMAENLAVNSAAFASVHEALQRLPVSVHGGKATEFAVLEGPASAIADARRLPGVEAMWLDREIVR